MKLTISVLVLAACAVGDDDLAQQEQHAGTCETVGAAIQLCIDPSVPIGDKGTPRTTTLWTRGSQVARWTVAGGVQSLPALPPDATILPMARHWEVIQLDHDVKSPRDAASGLATGRTMSSPTHEVITVGDFDGDGDDDLLWRSPTGSLVITFDAFLSNRAASIAGGVLRTSSLAGVGDFDGDRKTDLAWRQGGTLEIWRMDGAHRAARITSTIPGGWVFGAIGDFDGDQRADVLWRDGAASARIWYAGNPQTASPSFALSAARTVVGAQDFDGNGRADLLMTRTLGVGWTRETFATSYLDGGVVTDASWKPALPY